MAELLDGPTAPDAVFAFSDELALGALHVAHERGLRVPEDLAILGFDDIEDGRYSHPPLRRTSSRSPNVPCSAWRTAYTVPATPSRRRS